MSYEMKDNTFTIFPNLNKKEDKHPDFKIEMMFKGEKIKAAIWKKKDKNGNGFYSGTFDLNDSYTPKQSTQSYGKQDPLDDSMPF
jgi:uncharacterized protein (DUF736 family)